MQTNRIIFLNILIVLLIGCKKETNAQNRNILDIAKTKKIEVSKTNYLESLQYKSFVVSCGGGCFIKSKRFINQNWLELIRE